MYTHEEIWAAIDRLAKAHGYSASGLSIKAGLDPTSFNKSKRKRPDGHPRWPSMESINKVLSVTGTTMAEFLEPPHEEIIEEYNQSTSIPVLGFAEAGQEGYFAGDGAPILEKWGEVPLDHFTGEDLFALEVSGNSMLPLYRDGDLIILSESTHLKKGDRAVFKLTSDEIMVKEVASTSNGTFILKSINPDYGDISVKKSDVLWHGRVVWVSQ